MKVKFLAPYKDFPWFRQTPNDDGMVNGVQFTTDPDCKEYEYLVVYDYLNADIVENCDLSKIIFVASEPQNVKKYNNKFLQQFHTVLTTDHDAKHDHKIYTQVGLPWHIGVFQKTPHMKYKDFENWRPEKTKMIAVICSNKIFTEQHRRRLDFVQKLKDHFGDRLDVFGRGFHEVEDKIEVLKEYRYHIALENCDYLDYWTEKIADPVLALSYPFYWGCVNLEDYLPANSFVRIDISNPSKAIEIIEHHLVSDSDIKYKDNLIEARRQILTRHNIFPLLARVIHGLESKNKDLFVKKTIKILPEISFMPKPNIAKRAFNKFKFIMSGNQYFKKMIWFLSHCFMRLKDKFSRILSDLKKNIEHHYKMIAVEEYRSHQNWIKINGDQTLRFDYSLNKDSVVFDVGGYKAEWAQPIYNLFGCNIYVFEPIEDFSQKISQKFLKNEKIKVFSFGLGDKDKDISISLDENASSIFKSNENSTVIEIKDVHAFIKDHNILNIDLMKLNIEGGEYDVLSKLIETGDVERVKDIQVQFHSFVPNAKEKYKALAKKLLNTHTLTWRYPFVWENWRRKDIAK